MIGLTIAFPQMVMHYKGSGPVADPATMKIEIPGFDPGGGLDAVVVG
jgi:hypothetical protein